VVIGAAVFIGALFSARSLKHSAELATSEAERPQPVAENTSPRNSETDRLVPEEQTNAEVPEGTPTADKSALNSLNNPGQVLIELPSKDSAEARSRRCRELGLGNADCFDYDAAVKELGQAWTAYACPTKMWKGHEESVVFRTRPHKDHCCF
jgi:hypothetical protein